MIMAVNWVNIYKKYKGLWIALKDDEKTVIASGKNAREAFTRAQNIGYPTPILTKVPQKITALAG